MRQYTLANNDLCIEYEDIMTSAKVQDYREGDGIKVFKLVDEVKDGWTYGHIKLPGNMKVCEGSKNDHILSLACDGTELKIPTDEEVKAGLTQSGHTLTDKEYLPRETVDACLQNWYGEYYLPNNLHVRLTAETKDPLSVDYSANVDSKATESDEKFEYDSQHTFDFSDDYWLKDGYLVVNFEIKTQRNNELEDHLAYNAKPYGDSHCPNGDMWEIEQPVKENLQKLKIFNDK